MRAYARIGRMGGIKGGAPCFKNTGVLVEFIGGRFVAGDDIASIAEDYGVPEETVEEAIALLLESAFNTRGWLPAEAERKMRRILDAALASSQVPAERDTKTKI